MKAPGVPVRPEVAVGAVAVEEGALLLVRRGRPPQAGSWSLPGGRVERGETLARAVEREVGEETGLVVHCGRLVGWAERIGPDHHFVILDFAVTVVDRRLSPGDDAAEAAWVPVAELGRLPLVEGLEDFLRGHHVI